MVSTVATLQGDEISGSEIKCKRMMVIKYRSRNTVVDGEPESDSKLSWPTESEHSSFVKSCTFPFHLRGRDQIPNGKEHGS